MTDLPPLSRTERGILSMALTLGPDLPPALRRVRAADFYEVRHRRLWIAAAPPIDWDAAIAAAGSAAYLGSLALEPWPADAAMAAHDLRAAAIARRLIDAAAKLADAWADDDRRAIAREIGSLAEAAAATLAATAKGNGTHH
jgi:hypothetical protein